MRKICLLLLGLGLAAVARADSCTATLSGGARLSLPVVRLGVTSSEYLAAELEATDTGFRLTRYTKLDSVPNCPPAVVLSNGDVFVPAVSYLGATYWADLQLTQKTPDYRYRVTGFGLSTPAAADATFYIDAGLRLANATISHAYVAADGKVTLAYGYHATLQTPGPFPENYATAADGLNFNSSTPTAVDALSATLMPDGTYRNYRYNINKKTLESRLSRDGVSFVDESGTRYSLDAGDNNSFGVYTAYRMAGLGVGLLYIGDLAGVNNVRRAYSNDAGLSFTLVDANPLGDAKSGTATTFVDPNALVLPDQRIRLVTMRQFPGGFPPAVANNAIVSFISQDGASFAMEQGWRLVYSDFSEFKVYSLNDPKLVRLADGRYRIYVTAMVDTGNGQKNWAIVSATTR